MKRILSSSFFTLLLLFATMSSAVASMDETAPVIDKPILLFEKNGEDGLGFAFTVQLYRSTEMYDELMDTFYGEEDNNGLTVTESLQKEADGDLRMLDEIDYLKIDELALHARSGTEGALTDLTWYRGDLFITIRGSQSGLHEYPKNKKRTLLSDLLDTKTTIKAAEKLQRIVDEHGFTEEACNLIKAELEKEYTPAWVLPTAICGGAVALAAAVAVPTVILRRKKRKAAAATAVDAPAPDEGEGV